ncbi:hypothetical protein QIS74_10590 [Colletotrichum tabaci]|uniref:Enoyl reductase (ER) domain-containing protein n=1 Tax=Colletotrichum tabaci TaxID=1209068 RepID=A0AAV9T113_9PEZI
MRIPVNTLPATRIAVVQGDDGHLRIDHGVPMPVPKPNELLVQVKAVAINPCDHKMYERFPAPGAIDGCDFSGVVVGLGADVKTFRTGDRVCGAVHGSNPLRTEVGSFTEYTVAESEFTLKVPPDMSFQEAVGLSVTGLSTLGMALIKGLALPGTPEEPSAKPLTVLVHGSSSSVGTLALQLLRLMGHVPIATCSPKNFEHAKKHGAEEVFDYNDETCAAKIKAYTRNSLSYVLDPFTDAKSVALCFGAMGRAGGRYECLEMYPPYATDRKSIKVHFTMGMGILGHRLDLDYGYERDEDPAMRAWGMEWYRSLQWLLDQRKLRPHTLKELPGGFQGILEGIDMLKNKQVSCEKLIVTIDAS